MLQLYLVQECFAICDSRYGVADTDWWKHWTGSTLTSTPTQVTACCRLVTAWRRRLTAATAQRQLRKSNLQHFQLLHTDAR